MPDVNLTIDGHKVTVPAGTLIVEAATVSYTHLTLPTICSV